MTASALWARARHPRSRDAGKMGSHSYDRCDSPLPICRQHFTAVLVGAIGLLESPSFPSPRPRGDFVGDSSFCGFATLSPHSLERVIKDQPNCAFDRGQIEIHRSKIAWLAIREGRDPSRNRPAQAVFGLWNMGLVAARRYEAVGPLAFDVWHVRSSRRLGNRFALFYSNRKS